MLLKSRHYTLMDENVPSGATDTNSYTFYWDTNVGVGQYNTNTTFYKTKPAITGVTYDALVYSANVSLKVTTSGNTKTTSALTTTEISAIKTFLQGLAS